MASTDAKQSEYEQFNPQLDAIIAPTERCKSIHSCVAKESQKEEPLPHPEELAPPKSELPLEPELELLEYEPLLPYSGSIL
jgi:hypothetical protein